MPSFMAEQEPAMRRAVLYLRVSTIDQTTANQERELREIAGWAVRPRSTRITASAVQRATRQRADAMSYREK